MCFMLVNALGFRGLHFRTPFQCQTGMQCQCGVYQYIGLLSCGNCRISRVCLVAWSSSLCCSSWRNSNVVYLFVYAAHLIVWLMMCLPLQFLHFGLSRYVMWLPSSVDLPQFTQASLLWQLGSICLSFQHLLQSMTCGVQISFSTLTYWVAHSSLDFPIFAFWRFSSFMKLILTTCSGFLSGPLFSLMNFTFGNDLQISRHRCLVVLNLTYCKTWWGFMIIENDKPFFVQVSLGQNHNPTLGWLFRGSIYQIIYPMVWLGGISCG